MQNTIRKLSVKNSLLCVWSILCILIFIYYPGRVSFLQWAILANWEVFPTKLIRIDLIRFAIDLLYSFIGVTVFSLSCFSLGMLFTKRLQVFRQESTRSSLSRLAVFSTNFLLGHAFLSLIFLTLAGLYEINRITVAIILLIGLISGSNQLKSIIPKLFVKIQMENRNDKIIFWLSIVILLLTILQSSARISYDSTAIYFSDAKLTATTNQIQFFTTGTFEASVFQTAIQYTALIQVFGDQAARMFSWVCGIVIVIFSLALGERVGLSKPARIVLLALISTSTAFIDLLGDGKVDLISSMPAIAAIYWMVVHNQNRTSGKSAYLLIGFLIGLAIVGRPFNAFLLVIFAVLFYLQKAFLLAGSKPANFKIFFDSIFWIGVGAIGLGIYHLFANWMIRGNPFAFLSSFTNINLASGPWDADPNQILALRLFYPFIAVFRNTPQSLGNISPLAIAFLPSLLIAGVRKKLKLSKELLSLVTISVVTIVLWISLFFTVVELRYVFFLWIILFLPTAEIIVATLDTVDPLFQVVVRASVITLLIFINFRTLFISLDSYSPVDQQGNPQCYDLDFCEVARVTNNLASLGERVLALHPFRYYLRSDLFTCSSTYEDYLVLKELSHIDSLKFWEEVYRRGFKYITYQEDYTVQHLQFGFIPAPDDIPDWMDLETVFRNKEGLEIVYQIHVANPPMSVEASCEKNPKGIWEVKTTR